MLISWKIQFDITKNRSILDKLKDKEYSEFLHEQDKEEQDFLDELSLNMYYKDLNKEDEIEYFEDNEDKKEEEENEDR